MNFNEISGGITAASGFKTAGVKTGVKNSSLDLAIIHSEKSAETAAIYTTNQVQAAPIKICKDHLENGLAQSIVINSGIANACTGSEGYKKALKMTETAADCLKIPPEKVLVASTGIIGKQLPISKITGGIKEAAGKLDRNSSEDAARAILTTDTVTKQIATSFEIKGKKVKIGGMAKGSGMIEPNMATMLSFITTDASIEKGLLAKTLKSIGDSSFNKITVDGDQSTNDMVTIMANGMAETPPISADTDAYKKFKSALKYVAEELAKMIVKDGEGGTKFIEVEVHNAPGAEEAEKIARQIANSPLVKTAIFGEAPSWGRIAAAAGSADDTFDSRDLEIAINGEKIFGPGERVHQFSRDILTRDKINIAVKLGAGEASKKIWTCDFSPEYIDINAKYYS